MLSEGILKYFETTEKKKEYNIDNRMDKHEKIIMEKGNIMES